MIADDEAKVRENGMADRWVSSAEARDVNLEVCMVCESCLGGLEMRWKNEQRCESVEIYIQLMGKSGMSKLYDRWQELW